MTEQFKDERCSACGHSEEDHCMGVMFRRCAGCPADRRCQRFVKRSRKQFDPRDPTTWSPEFIARFNAADPKGGE